MTYSVASQSNRPKIRTALSSAASLRPIKKNAKPKKANRKEIDITCLIRSESNFDTINRYDPTADTNGIVSAIIAIIFLLIF